MVLEEPESASELVLKKPVKTPPPPPSEEAQKLADIALDTIDAFDRRFKGDLSFRHPMPGMIATDDSAVKYETLLTSMIESAFQERVRAFYHDKTHVEHRAEQLEDEARRKADAPNYAKEISDAVPEMLQKIEDQMKGVKHIKPDEKAAAGARHTIAVLGLEPTGPLRSIYDPPPPEESGAESTATTDPPPEESGDGSTTGS